MMNISDGIIIRYEERIENGTLYIFDLNREKIYKGKRLEYDLLHAIQTGTLECYKKELLKKREQKTLIKKSTHFSIF